VIIDRFDHDLMLLLRIGDLHAPRAANSRMRNIAVARNLVANDDPALRGIFHCVGTGEASWAEFAEGIFAASVDRGGPTARVRHIATADYPTPARRPANSRMDCSKLVSVHGVQLPDWHGSVGDVVARLLAH